MKKLIFFRTLFITALMCTPFLTSAQVTIGSTEPPSPFSLLYLDASEQQRALHNARLTTDMRNALVTPDSLPEVRDLAQGLLLFNTDHNCLEFWNGAQWVSLCDGDTPDPCGGFGEMNIIFCSGATIADLTARAREAGGRGIIRWFSSASGGNQLADSHVLVGTQYYADNCAGIAGRVPVQVSLINCASLTARSVTAWTNAMYDFQNQTLSYIFAPAFSSDQPGGDAASWQWQVSTDGTNWQDINGATSATFHIPAYFVYDNGFMVRGTDGQAPSTVEFNARELHFRVVRTNPAGTLPSASLGIYFIRTNTSGFGTHQGVRYLTMNRAPEGGAGSGNPNTIRLALLNLGATDDNSLGDMYQWGRRADGHQTIVWEKTAVPGMNLGFSGTNVFGAGTSGTVARDGETSVIMGSLDANGQVLGTHAAFGNFITAPSADWVGGAGISGRNDLWGSGGTTRPGLPFTLRARNNDPCPPGWRVPTRWEWFDMNTGTGTGNPANTSLGATVAHNNAWLYRGPQVRTGAVGGALVTNQSGETVFLPAVGWRLNTNNTLSSTGTNGRYWSSTFHTNETHSWVLAFFAGNLTAGNTTGIRARSYSVRCVAE